MSTTVFLGGGRITSPLVAGLPSKPAEFIRARVSQVARDSHAPLGSEHCKPNLIVVITNDPDLLLEKKINMGQLADYIAMIGLAQIRVHADTGTAPSILHLFQGSDPQPLGLSPWDESFLKALYRIEHLDQHQLAAIKSSMVQDVAP